MSNVFKTIQSIKNRVNRESQSIIDVINVQLKELYGVDTVTGLPIFRIIWSDDEMEVRHGTFDDFVPGTDIYLRTVTETRTVPKYRQWVQAKHILERLVIVPEMNADDLPVNKVSYEPLWIFQDRNDEYLSPSLEAAQFVVKTVLEAQAVNKMMIDGTEKIDRQLVRYVDPDNSQEAERDNRRARIDGLVEELFGDESGLGGETHNESGSAIIVPQSYKQ